jgi:hypothetical protein
LQRLVGDRDQADRDVEAGQAGGVEVLAENSQVGSRARPRRVHQDLVTGGGDAEHGPARVVGLVLGHRLHVGLPDRGLVNPSELIHSGTSTAASSKMMMATAAGRRGLGGYMPSGDRTYCGASCVAGAGIDVVRGVVQRVLPAGIPGN